MMMNQQEIFKKGQIVRVGQTHFYGKIIGFSKNKKFYIIQWLSTPPHPNNQINVLNQNLRIWSEIGVHYRL